MWNIGSIQMQATLHIHRNIYRTVPKNGAGAEQRRRKRRKER
jgi:hypothetical protein